MKWRTHRNDYLIVQIADDMEEDAMYAIRLYRSRYYVEWKITFINSSNSAVVVAFIRWITCSVAFHIMLHVIQLIDSFGFVFRYIGFWKWMEWWLLTQRSKFIYLYFDILWFHFTKEMVGHMYFMKSLHKINKKNKTIQSRLNWKCIYNVNYIHDPTLTSVKSCYTCGSLWVWHKA